MATPRNSILGILLAVTGLLLPAAPKAFGQNTVYWTPPSSSVDWFNGLNWHYANGTNYYSAPTASDIAYIPGGAVTVASPGATASQTLLNGSLSIINGGSLTNSYGYIGLSSGFSSTVTVGGGTATSTWTNSTSLVVGNFGTGNLTINLRGLVITPDLAGGNASSFVNFNGGTLRITATDSASNNFKLISSGVLNLPTAGTTFTHSGSITGGSVDGDFTKTGAGELVLTGTSNFNGFLRVQGGGLTIASGGSVTSTAGEISNGAGSTVNVGGSGAASSWTMSGNLTVGQYGAGALAVNAGGTVTSASLDISSVYAGTVNVSGTLNSGTLGVGNFKSGTLTISAGGVVNSSNVSIGCSTVAYPTATGAYGTVTVDGGTWNLSSGSALSIGKRNSNTLTITNGGTVSTPYATVFGYTSGGYTAINIGGGTGTSTFNVSSGFDLSAAKCDIILNSGGILSARNLYDAGNAYSVIYYDGGTLRINSTTTSNTRATIRPGGGTIDTPSGTNFTMANTIIGSSGGSLTKTGAGQLTLGNVLSMNGPLTVAGGNLSLVAGPNNTISTGAANIAPTAGTAASVTVGNSSVWTINGALTIGSSGTLNINSGSIVSTAGLNGTGLVNLDGGTLRITSSGTSSNSIGMSLSTVTIDLPTAGSLFTLAGTINGSGDFNKTGAGTLEVTGPRTNAYRTVVQAGTFLVNNTSGSATGGGSVIVNSGGTLAGGNPYGTKGFIAPDINYVGNTQSITIDGSISPGNGVNSIGVLTLGTSNTATKMAIPGTYAFNIATTYRGESVPVNYGVSSAPRTETTGNNLLVIRGTSTTIVNFSGMKVKLNATSDTLGTNYYNPDEANWDNTKYFSWLLATLPDGVTPNLASVTIDTSNFAPSLNGGSFSLFFSPETDSIYLNFTPVPVPEPAFILATCLVPVAGGLVRRRLRHRPV
jgi:fibronectin-binding autotransporter adhesin